MLNVIATQKLGRHITLQFLENMEDVFFPPAPFFRKRSQVDDCFTGQSPGNAISIPAAPDVHEWLGQIQPSAP